MKYFSIILLVICYWIGNLSFANVRFIDSNKAPPGFERFGQPQQLRIKLWFMNRFIGDFQASVGTDTLIFQAPETIVQSLTNVDKQAVLTRLRQPLPLNINCSSNQINAPHCRKLQTKSLYIIYFPAEEKASLYLAPTLFKQRRASNALAYIPASTSDWSYLNKLGAAGSFNNRQSFFSNFLYPSLANYYNLYSNNTIAYQNNSLIANVSQNSGLNQQTHFQIQNLYGQRIDKDKIYSAGYVINPSSPFLQSQILAGAGVKTTLDTLENANNFTTTPLVIFVPQASQVSVFKNEQLIFSQYLDVGYQTIDTRNFPEGGYELIVKMGTTTLIRQFFCKGLSLPPRNLPQFYLVGGYLTNGLLLFNQNYDFLPKILDVPVLETGTSYRLSERLALFGDFLLTSRQGLVDIGHHFLFKNASITMAGLATTRGNYGAYTAFNLQKNKLNFNLMATKILYQHKNQNYFFLNNIIDNDSASVTYQLSQKDTLGVQANYNRVLEQATNYNASTFYQRQLGNYHGLGLFFNAIYSKVLFAGNTYSINLTVNFSHQNIAGSESLAWQHQAASRYYNPLASPVVLQGNTTYSHQNEQGLGYNINEIHTLSPTLSSVAGVYNYTAEQGFLASYINYNQAKHQIDALEYGGSAETEIAVNARAFGVTGQNRNQNAGIIVKVSTASNDAHAKFALLDDQQRQIAVISANKSKFIPLPAFTHQKYRLINLSDSDYFIQNARPEVTLYPGNLNYYHWYAQRRIIVIGQITRQQATLANTWVHQEDNGIFTDNQGHFQLELADDVTTLTVDNLCYITLPSLKTNKAYIYVGKLACV